MGVIPTFPGHCGDGTLIERAGHEFGRGTLGEGVWCSPFGPATERGREGHWAEERIDALTPRSVLVTSYGEEVAVARSPKTLRRSGVTNTRLGQAQWVADTLRSMEVVALDQALPEVAQVLRSALQDLEQACADRLTDGTFEV